MAKDKLRSIELLAPARNVETGIQAIIHGADAVYIGASSHGARSAAGNSIEDISRLVQFAHKFDAKVYVTVNTIIYENELEEVKSLIEDLYRIGVDALIVQDMAVLKLDLPPIAIHASTQCDIQSVEKAKFLSTVGFSQLVLARELSLSEIREIHSAVDVPLEAFVHGALCVCYSGDCQAGYMAMHRSANRGECPQICRLSYNLIDGNGTEIISRKHLLSLKDMNRLDYLQEMIEAGVSSFKIEGRLKNVTYVKNVVSVYRKALDKIISENSDKYKRSSLGYTEYYFEPTLDNSFNRGFTNYFLTDLRPVHLASFDTPKSIGKQVGKVISCRSKVVEFISDQKLNNGDGLGFFDASGVFVGFRVNKVERNKLILRNPIKIPAGTVIYRNKDIQADAVLAKETAMRYIPVNIMLRSAGNGRISSTATIAGTNMSASAVIEVEMQKAKSVQNEARKRVFSKLGDTVYRLNEFSDQLGDLFIPASVLTELRRQTIETLDSSRTASYQYDYRHSEKTGGILFNGGIITRHDNVANSLARQFYMEHGAVSVEQALEVSASSTTDKNELQVMKTRYCLRREMNKCLKTAEGKTLKGPLTLVSGNLHYRLDFDCVQCRMKVIFLSNKN